MKKYNSKSAMQKFDFLLLACSVVLFAAIQAGFSMDLIGSFWKLNIILICINIIMSASLNLINGYTGQFSLGHAGFMAVGAYVSVILTTNFGAPLIAGMVLGGACAAFLGCLIGLPTLRLNGDYLAIATLGLGEIIRIVIMNIEYVGGAAGFTGIPHLTTFPWVFVTMIVTLFFIKNFVNSTHGRACIAVRENEIAAAAMGINITRYKVMAFTIGAAFAGIGGALFAHCFYIINPSSFTFMQSFNFLIMVVMGGLGSLTGSIAGAFVVTALSAALASWPEFRMIIYALALIFLMFYRPQGLFGYVELTAYAPFNKLKFLNKEGGQK
ncbi:MAG: branched-chain amino acid ABC transporter permease [Schwartzia sp.]|nr:branched-chain amino acid ABC transporter permease [Schwartzia sp. (in: firmicutes)]